MNNVDKPINPVLTQSESLQNDTSLGLTKREHASIEAMKGFTAGLKYYTDTLISERTIRNVAKNSIAFSDELLKQLETK